MTPFLTLDGFAAPIEGRNIDTDQIIPARFLKKKRGEYADYLFYDLRVDTDHQPRKDFVLNQEVYRRTNILVCDENFGCGSSREAAVYALVDFGIKAILAPSYGDIFYNNCLKNGVLPIVLPHDTLLGLRRNLTQDAAQASKDSRAVSALPASQISPEAPNGLRIKIDLAQCTVQCAYFAQALHFEIDPFWQECLIKGVDEIELTLGYQTQIHAFEQQHRLEQPWLSNERSA